MLSRKTLFVIGAGASYELGLPTGLELKAQVSQLLNITFEDGFSQSTGDHQIASQLREHSRLAGRPDWNPLLQKCWQIRDALPGAISIDNVLDAHSSDEDIIYCGKLAIAKAILNGERKSVLYRQPQQRKLTVFERAAGSWLIPFFQILTEGVRKERISQIFENISIINFNYDRSIEYFMPEALIAYYGISENDAYNLANNLDIVHPYGRVGTIRAGAGFNYAEFGNNNVNINEIANNIRTFTEGISDETLNKKIKNEYSQAEQIIFLGFAFHPINLEMMSASSACAVRKIFATVFGFSDPARREAERMVLSSLRKNIHTPIRSESAFSENYVDEMNFEMVTAVRFLESHFRGIAS